MELENAPEPPRDNINSEPDEPPQHAPEPPSNSTAPSQNASDIQQSTPESTLDCLLGDIDLSASEAAPPPPPSIVESAPEPPLVHPSEEAPVPVSQCQPDTGATL